MRRSSEFLWARQDDFYRDRPLMAEHNESLLNLCTLLIEEIHELNGHTADGLSLEQYRVQELADIGWFTVSMAHNLDFHLDDTQLQTEMQATGLERDASLEWTEENEAAYSQVKRQMEVLADRLGQQSAVLADNREITQDERATLQEVLTSILAHVAALSQYLGQELDDAMLEKLARNHLKHAPYFYDENIYPSYEIGRAQAKTVWSSIDGNPAFYQTGQYQEHHPMEHTLR